MDDLELGIAAAWHGEGFARTKRLPELDKVLVGEKQRARRIDHGYTQREAKRWAALLASQGKPS